jgi:cold shock protein
VDPSPSQVSIVRGRVKWFDLRKGYGFIESAAGQDVFVHFKEIADGGFRTLQQGEQVEFTLQDGPKGPSAKQVRSIGTSI